jgi:hypothetical protein
MLPVISSLAFDRPAFDNVPKHGAYKRCSARRLPANGGRPTWPRGLLDISQDFVDEPTKEADYFTVQHHLWA